MLAEKARSCKREKHSYVRSVASDGSTGAAVRCNQTVPPRRHRRIRSYSHLSMEFGRRQVGDRDFSGNRDKLLFSYYGCDRFFPLRRLSGFEDQSAVWMVERLLPVLPCDAKGRVTYSVNVAATRAPGDYTARFVLHHPTVAVPLEAGAILWQRCQGQGSTDVLLPCPYACYGHGVARNACV